MDVCRLQGWDKVELEEEEGNEEFPSHPQVP